MNYEMDIAARIPWDDIDLSAVTSMTLSMYDEKDIEHIATLADDDGDVIRQKTSHLLQEGAIRIDPVFMTRQVSDIIPNPWQAHAFAEDILQHFRRKGYDEQLIANNFVLLIEELRKCVELEKDRLAEGIFRAMLKKDELRFLIIGNNFDWTFPKHIAVKTERTLTRRDGTPLQASLFEFMPEEEFNDTEKAVAWYLENQTRLSLLVPESSTEGLCDSSMAPAPHLSRFYLHVF